MDLSARNAVSQKDDEKVPKWREKQVKRLTVNKENFTNQISLLKIDTSANLNNARQNKSRLNKNYEHRTLNKISY